MADTNEISNNEEENSPQQETNKNPVPKPNQATREEVQEVVSIDNSSYQLLEEVDEIEPINDISDDEFSIVSSILTSRKYILD